MATQARRETILTVDDERGPRESLRMVLAPRYHVLGARNGSEALEILRTHSVDLVTLDLNMPGMRGEDAMRTIHAEFPEVALIVITGCGSLESATAGIRYGIADYLQKPFDVLQVMASVERALAKQRGRDRLISFLAELGCAVGADADALAIVEDIQRSQRLRTRMGWLFNESESDRECGAGGGDPTRTSEFLEVLAETLETKDRFMRGHARRVAFYASLMAHRLCLSAEDHEHVRIAAFLHDLGKVGVSTQLLVRPGALTPSERAEVERHPHLGSRLLRPLDLPPAVEAGVRHHHEWWDGTGYPDGLAAEEIPLTARIIGVADAFDAMSCDRPYRRALRRVVVIEELRRFSATQFDPALVKEFLAILETGVCDIDPELVADAVGDATAPLSLPLAS